MLSVDLKSNSLILISLFCSILGLILIYTAAKNIQPEEMDINDITPELIGRSVSTSGKIVYKKLHPAGHLFLTISDNRTKIQVPLFAGLMNNMEENGIEAEDFKLGYFILVSGLVDEYQGQLQIIPRKVDDIKIVSE